MGQLYSCFISRWGHVINLIFRIIINSYLQTDEINQQQCMYELFKLNVCLSSVLAFNMHYNVVYLTDAFDIFAGSVAVLGVFIL